MRRRGPGRLLPLAALLLLAASPLGVRAEEETWGEGEVARVADRSLGWEDLCRAAVAHMAPGLDDRRSAAYAVYATLAFDRVLDRLCAEHGIEVDAGAVAAAWEAADAELRARTGRGLEATLRARMTPRRAQERDLGRRLRVAALRERGVDARAAYLAAPVRRALATADHPVPDPLPEGVVLEVHGEPVTEVEFGDRLLAIAGPRQVGEVLDRACRIRLAEARGARLDDATMEAELGHLRTLAPLESQFDPEEVWEQFAVRGGVARDESYTEAQVRQSVLARSLFGLVRRFREDASPADVRRAWERRRTTLYGPHVLVTDVSVPFRSPGDVFAPVTGRTRAQARELAREARRLLLAHRSGGEIAALLEPKGLEAGWVRRLRLYPTDRDRLLWEEARTMEDGSVGGLVETLSEFHAMRREREVPAPSFATVEPLVRERLARQRARRWLEDQLADPEVVRRRWPPPQLR